MTRKALAASASLPALAAGAMAHMGAEAIPAEPAPITTVHALKPAAADRIQKRHGVRVQHVTAELVGHAVHHLNTLYPLAKITKRDFT